MRRDPPRRPAPGFLDACKRQKNVELNVLAKALRFEQRRGRRHACTWTDGERIEGCALIGADGLWSRIRNQLLGDGKPRVSGHIAYRAVLPRADVPEDLWQNNVVLWAGPNAPFVHYPLRRGELYNLVAVFHSDQYEEGWNVYGDRSCSSRTSTAKRRRCCACWRRSTPGACGCCATASRCASGRAGASRCSATPRTRRCNTWRRAPTWRSRTRWCSPPTSSCRARDLRKRRSGLPGRALSAHRAGADHLALLRRPVPRRRRHRRIARPRAHGPHARSSPMTASPGSMTAREPR